MEVYVAGLKVRGAPDILSAYERQLEVQMPASGNRNFRWLCRGWDSSEWNCPCKGSFPAFLGHPKGPKQHVETSECDTVGDQSAARLTFSLSCQVTAPVSLLCFVLFCSELVVGGRLYSFWD